jgi:hypothetical protein
VLAIPKALRSDHIKENATTCDISLPASLLEEIDREFRIKVERVPWRQIRPAPDQTGDPAVYTSIEEARANVAGHCPSPQDVATDIVRNDHIKPIRVTRLQGRDSGFRYALAEGRIRFWAWLLAFDGERDVPVLVRD